MKLGESGRNDTHVLGVSQPFDGDDAPAIALQYGSDALRESKVQTDFLASTPVPTELTLLATGSPVLGFGTCAVTTHAPQPA